MGNFELLQEFESHKKKEELAQQKGFEDAEDDSIESHIYYKIWKSDSCWKTVGAVTDELKNLNYKKKDRYAALKDNIQIRYKGFRWEECKTQWSKGGVNLSIVELTTRLKDLIKLQKKN